MSSSCDDEDDDDKEDGDGYVDENKNNKVRTKFWRRLTTTSGCGVGGWSFALG